MIGPYEFPPEFVWTNGAQSSLKVSVLTRQKNKRLKPGENLFENVEST